MAVQDAGAGLTIEIGGLDGQRLAVGQADAAEDNDLRTGRDAQPRRDLVIGGPQRRFQDAAGRLHALLVHLLGEAAQGIQILVVLGRGDVGALADAGVGQPFAGQQEQRLAGGHAADTELLGQLALGRQPRADGIRARLDLRVQIVPDLDVERLGGMRLHAHGMSLPDSLPAALPIRPGGVWSRVVYTASLISIGAKAAKVNGARAKPGKDPGGSHPGPSPFSVHFRWRGGTGVRGQGVRLAAGGLHPGANRRQ